MSARRRWAARLIAADPFGPVYGSPEWLALPDGSPAKVAAVVRAAECWAREGDHLEDRLRLEVVALSRAEKRAQDAAYQAEVARNRRDWTPKGYRVTDTERAEVEAEWWEWVTQPDRDLRAGGGAA